MKKFALALLVLALTLPASAAVNVTMTVGTGADANKVTVSYTCTASEEVRAFAMKIAVTNGKFAVGSPVSLSNDYYVHPSSIQFAVDSNGATYISGLGTPVAVQDVNGGVIETASLYAANDPNHKTAPPASGNLLSFRLNCGTAQETVTLSLDSQRGGIVLKDPNVTPTTNLPQSVSVCAPVCLVVGQYCGGVMITQAMYDNWVQIGKPASWCHPGHFGGDANMNCTINSIDLVGPALPNMKAAFGKSWPTAGYADSCDTDNNKSINAIDIVGGGAAVCVPNGCGAKKNFGRVLHGYPPLCP
jgi:hypothetical protein